MSVPTILMCGRTALLLPPNQIHELLLPLLPPNTRNQPTEENVEFPVMRRYNIAPTNTQPILKAGTTHLTPAKWGLKLFKFIINARTDSLTTSNVYKSIRSNRCIVPVSAFYEWKDSQPYCILFDSLCYFAGVWRRG